MFGKSNANVVSAVAPSPVYSEVVDKRDELFEKLSEEMEFKYKEQDRTNTVIYAVIGANYGDEGKGLVTNWLSTNAGLTLNILYNGGMQRGHTVQSHNKRHIFHCFGSGTLQGAKTYWAQPFIVDPEAVLIEANQLDNIELEIYAHPKCRVTTPFDAMMNRIKEDARGKARHGSCGMGIYETIQRSREIILTLEDCLNPFIVYDKLRKIKEYYRKLTIQMGADIENWNYIMKNYSIDNFMKGIKWIKENVILMNSPWQIQWDTVIFEGGQGLALSQNNTKDFPFLTPSFTGSEEIVKIIDDRPINVIYVTRSYLTRHGAGPLPNENNELRKKVPYDKTNVSNKYQGELRIADFEIDSLYDMKERIKNDLKNYKCKPWVSMFITQKEYKDDLPYKIQSNMVGIVDDIYISSLNKDGEPVIDIY